MGATAWRWLKVAVFAWGAVSLLGLTVLAGLAWSFNRDYERRVGEAEAPAAAAEQARALAESKLTRAGFGPGTLLALERRRTFGEGLDVQQVRVAPRAPVREGYAAPRLPAHVVVALEETRTRMRAAGEDWLAALPGEGWRVFVDDVGFDRCGIGYVDLVVLDPGRGTAWLIEGRPRDWSTDPCAQGS